MVAKETMTGRELLERLKWANGLTAEDCDDIDDLKKNDKPPVDKTAFNEPDAAESKV